MKTWCQTKFSLLKGEKLQLVLNFLKLLIHSGDQNSKNEKQTWKHPSVRIGVPRRHYMAGI